jgi:hypothetical protein
MKGKVTHDLPNFGESCVMILFRFWFIFYLFFLASPKFCETVNHLLPVRR